MRQALTAPLVLLGGERYLAALPVVARKWGGVRIRRGRRAPGVEIPTLLDDAASITWLDDDDVDDDDDEDLDGRDGRAGVDREVELVVVETKAPEAAGGGEEQEEEKEQELSGGGQILAVAMREPRWTCAPAGRVVTEGDVVLIKGSRTSRMERVLEEWEEVV